jgi:transcriptional regulator with XRE-family HTH domain
MQEIGTKIRLACTLAGISVSELARRIGTTPQNMSQRLKVGRFSAEELEGIAQALGAELRLELIFPDGSKV